MAQIDLVSATAEDYEELVSISGGIYKGTDYLPFRYHAWLKDHRRRMFLAKSDGKIVGFESFLLVDGGETAVVEGLRVAPSMRGQGVAGIIQRYVIDVLQSDYPQVKRVRLTRAEDPPPSMLQKYKVIHSKALLSVLIPSEQLEETGRKMAASLDNTGKLDNYSVLEPSEVLKLFDEAKTVEDLVPGDLLVQGWLPITTQRSNLEMLFERKITWIYSQVNEGSPSRPPSSTRFLSLGTPAFPVPYADATYRFDIDMYGTDPSTARKHVVDHLQMCIQSLPSGSSIICVMYAEESVRSELNQLCEGLTRVLPIKDQVILEMEI